MYSNIHTRTNHYHNGSIMDLPDELKQVLGPQLAKLNTPEAKKLAAECKKNSAVREKLTNFVTADPTMEKMKRDVEAVSSLPYPVLMTGESGTGKEVLSEAIAAGRKGKFVALNLAALNDNLIESELFGHAQGSFTGATRSKTGLLEYATGGTVFLDEIGELPITMQAKLLRTLQNKRIRPVGTLEEKPVDCRFIFATNRDLRQMVDKGSFKEDFYFRISTFEFHITPLRERPDDIDEILDAILDPDGIIPEETREKIKQLPLTGNFRELERIALRYIHLGLNADIGAR